MLQVEGKCPRCGHELTYWADMFVNDDCIQADIYDWVAKTGDHEGHFIMIGEPKCPVCETEIYVAIKTEAFITAISQFDPKQYVNYDDEQKLKKEAVVNFPRIFRKTHFEIDSFRDADGKQLLLEGYTDDQHWNGWECPRFEKEAADAIMAAVIACGQEVIYVEETEAYIYKDPDDPEQEDLWDSAIIQVNGEDIKIWAIGAWCWVWDEVDEDDLARRKAWAEEEAADMEQDALDVSQEMVLHDLRNDEMERRCDHE